MKDCPHCQGTGITRLDWVKVPVWQACSCAPAAALAITWNWRESTHAHATPEPLTPVTVPA